MDDEEGEFNGYLSATLRALAEGEDVWPELWDNLHHQGDVGEASYAAVPHVVRIAKSLPNRDWNVYGLVSTIEVQRHRKSNPPLPESLVPSYRQALQDLMKLALLDLAAASDRFSVQAMLATIALAKGHLVLGALIINMEASEMIETLDQYDALSECFSERPL